MILLDAKQVHPNGYKSKMKKERKLVMKHINKIMALVLALVMVMGLAVTASAAKIEIVTSDSGASVEGHTYEVYQIFKGVAAELDGEMVLADVAFGANYKLEDTDVEEAMAEIQAMTGLEAAAFLKEKISGQAIATLSDANNWKAELDDGYYLILDVSEDLPDTEEASAYILKVVGDVEIKSKHDATPVTYKKVDDVNDSTTEEVKIEWHDSADHDIGDLVDFQLTAVLPSSFESFKTHNAAYPFTFHDVESKGLKLQADTIKAYIVDGATKTEITSGYTVNENTEDGCSFEVVFTDLTQIAAAKGGAKLVVEYQSELTEEAVIGEEGNPNKMRGEFKNKFDSDEPSFTPWDVVIVFTFRAEVNKVNPENQPLEGAEFELAKFVVDENGSDEYTVGETTYTGKWQTIALEADDNDALFAFNGLDDGYYRVTETKAPAGYNTIDPFYFTVTAEHEIESADPKLTNLAADGGEVVEFTISNNKATMSTDVINEKGVELPSTGGIGTTIFYIVGGLLAVAAVVLLVTKKRMASAAE